MSARGPGATVSARPSCSHRLGGFGCATSPPWPSFGSPPGYQGGGVAPGGRPFSFCSPGGSGSAKLEPGFHGSGLWRFCPPCQHHRSAPPGLSRQARRRRCFQSWNWSRRRVHTYYRSSLTTWPARRRGLPSLSWRRLSTSPALPSWRRSPSTRQGNSTNYSAVGGNSRAKFSAPRLCQRPHSTRSFVGGSTGPSVASARYRQRSGGWLTASKTRAASSEPGPWSNGRSAQSDPVRAAGGCKRRDRRRVLRIPAALRSAGRHQSCHDDNVPLVKYR